MSCDSRAINPQVQGHRQRVMSVRPTQGQAGLASLILIHDVQGHRQRVMLVKPTEGQDRLASRVLCP